MGVRADKYMEKIYILYDAYLPYFDIAITKAIFASYTSALAYIVDSYPEVDINKLDEPAPGNTSSAIANNGNDTIWLSCWEVNK